MNVKKIQKLSPAFKDYIWGGTKLKALYGVKDMERVAEAWVLSAHPDGPSLFEDGRSFAEYADFPQLIKLIDAQNDLSVQVHPDDAYAQANEGQFGKTEMWYIVDAEKGAGIYYGFKDTVSREEVEQSIADNTLTELLRFVPVKKGECYFIPAGTVHAIGKGLLIAEIQQNSNITYRLYDYGRRDAQGNTRPLHVEKALAVANLCAAPLPEKQETVRFLHAVETKLAQCPYFKVSHLALNGNHTIVADDSFVALLVLSGCATVDGKPVQLYDTLYIPEGYGKVAVSGQCELLISSI